VFFGLFGVVWVVGFYAWFRNTPAEHPATNAAERELIEASVRNSGPAARLSWKTMLASPSLWFLCLMYFCSNAGWCLFITWDVEYLQKTLHLSGLPLRASSGGPLFFGGIACLLGGFLTDRQVRVWGRRWGRTIQGVVGYGLGGLFFLLAVQARD